MVVRKITMLLAAAESWSSDGAVKPSEGEDVQLRDAEVLRHGHGAHFRARRPNDDVDHVCVVG